MTIFTLMYHIYVFFLKHNNEKKNEKDLNSLEHVLRSKQY